MDSVKPHQPLLTVQNALCRVAGNDLLRIDSFTMEVGQHWCLFGPNGAGKSLFASLLLGQRRESANYVCYGAGFDPRTDAYIVSFEEQQRLWDRDNRLDISDFSDCAEDLGTLVVDLILSARPNYINDADDNDDLQRLLTQLDLHEVANKGIRFLSSGQIRKVLIARALFASSDDGPKLLVLDDPLESIDRGSQQQIADCIQQWMDSGNSTLLLCRRAQDIFPTVSHLAVMDGLTIKAQGLTDNIRGSACFREVIECCITLPDTLPSALNIGNTEEPARHDSSAHEPLVELRDVTASYRSQLVLNAVNWRMDSHHHVLIEGPNGCGKSTLLSLIDGDNHKAYGQNVRLFGRQQGSGETVWDIKSRFGIVSNELHNKYVKGWKVLDVVVSGFFDSVGLYDDSGASEKQAALAWLATLGVVALAKSYYHELSFGQQRLVLLARAMVKHPQVLILDEPCVGLDDYHRKLILGTLDVIATQTQTQLIYVSHVEGERPACINQHLVFVAASEGGYQLEEQGLN